MNRFFIRLDDRIAFTSPNPAGLRPVSRPYRGRSPTTAAAGNGITRDRPRGLPAPGSQRASTATSNRR